MKSKKQEGNNSQVQSVLGDLSIEEFTREAIEQITSNLSAYQKVPPRVNLSLNRAKR